MLKKPPSLLAFIVACVKAWRRPNTVTVQRKVRIDAPPDRIYPLIADLRQWPRWSPWEDQNPEMKRQYHGPPSGVGAAYSWQGNSRAADGGMRITAAVPPRRLDLNADFGGPVPTRNRVAFRIEADGRGSRVTWSLTADAPYVLRVLGTVVDIDAKLGSDLERGLANLERVIARGATPPPLP